MTHADPPIALPPADPGASAPQHARAVLLICALVALLGYFDLGRRDATNSLEVSYALTVQEMVRDGDWLVPRLNERPRLVKPPVPFWTAAAVCELVHGDEAPLPTLRAVALATGALAAIGLYFLGTSMFDRRAGLWAALVWITMFLAFLEYRYARHDIFLTAAVALAMLGLWRAWKRRAHGWTTAAIGLVLAFQAKGPVSWALIVLPAAVFALGGRRLILPRLRHRPRPGDLLLSIGPAAWQIVWSVIHGRSHRCRFTRRLLLWTFISGLSFLPWMFAVQHAAGVDFWEEYRWEAIGRFTASNAPYQPPWYYLQYIGYVLPWAAYLIAGLVIPFERKYAARRRALRFAWLWLVVGLVFMSLPREKNARYVVPLLAPAALLAGQIIAFHLRLWRHGRRDPGARPLWIGHAAVLVAAAAVMIVGGHRVGYGPVMWTGAALVVLATAIGWCFHRNQVLHATVLSVVFAALGAGSFALSENLSPRHAEPNRQLAGRLVELVDGRPIAAWPAGPSHALAYYADRSIPAVANRLLIHEYLPDVDRADLRRRWSDPNTRRADRLTALGHWLDRQDGDPVYIVTLRPKLAMLRDFAARRGARAELVMDLTTLRAHTGKAGDPYVLVRLTPSPAADRPPRS